MFLDYLTIKQMHLDHDLPKVIGGRITSVGPDLDEILWESESTLRLTGSHETSLGIRCDGHEVTLSGNVGRFGRPDNVFNLDLEQTISKASEIVGRFGLPPFTAGQQVHRVNPSMYDIRHGLLTKWTGATVSQIHLTENLSAGTMFDAHHALNWLQGQSAARIRKGTGGHGSCSWGTKRGRKLLKAYLKSLELLNHAGSASQRKTMLESKIYQYCENVGLLRIELEAHRLMLRDQGLNYLGNLTMGKLYQLFHKETEILRRVTVDAQSLDIQHIPKPFRSTALLHIRGENTRELLSTRTFFRHAKALRQYGIDISEPTNVTALQFRARLIDLKPMAAPDWYWQESAFTEHNLAA